MGKDTHLDPTVWMARSLPYLSESFATSLPMLIKETDSAKGSVATEENTPQGEKRLHLFNGYHGQYGSGILADLVQLMGHTGRSIGLVCGAAK